MPLSLLDDIVMAEEVIKQGQGQFGDVLNYCIISKPFSCIRKQTERKKDLSPNVDSFSEQMLKYSMIITMQETKTVRG